MNRAEYRGLLGFPARRRCIAIRMRELPDVADAGAQATSRREEG